MNKEKCKHCKKSEENHKEFGYCLEKRYYNRQDTRFTKGEDNEIN